MSWDIDALTERTRREMEEARMISELSLSPADGSAAFLLRRADFGENRYRISLFRQRGEAASENLGDGAWSAVLWTPKGALLGAQRATGGTRLLHLTESGTIGGERLVPVAGKPVAADDNGNCLLLTRVFQRDHAAAGAVFTDDYPLFHNDAGLVADSRAALVYDCAADGTQRRITEPEFTVNLFAADLTRGIVVTAGKEYRETPGYCEEIRVYSLPSGASRRFLTQPRWSIAQLALWRGGVVFAGTDTLCGVQSGTRLMHLDLESGALTALSGEDHSVGNSVICDFRFGAGKSLVGAEDGIYASVTRNEQSELWRFTGETGWEPLCQDMDTVDMLGVGGGRILFSGHPAGQRTELFEYLRDGVRQRSAFHPPLVGPAVQPLSVIVNGTEIRGFVLPPEHIEPGRRYPAVLSIHGGPRSTFGRPAGHDHRLLSQAGAFVIWCNPTGSDGRGSDFYDLHGAWGSEKEEQLAFLEEAVRRYPIDPARLGVMGASYGGYMVNLLIATTDRFAAAVSERGIAVLPWQEMLGDLPVSYRTKQFAGGIFDNSRQMWLRSPLCVMDKGTTPTLFIQADADYRCPLVHGAAMYRALVRRGTEARMIVFHGENHAVNRMGRPLNRLRRYREIAVWFRDHLGMT